MSEATSSCKSERQKGFAVGGGRLAEKWVKIIRMYRTYFESWCEKQRDPSTIWDTSPRIIYSSLIPARSALSS